MEYGFAAVVVGIIAASLFIANRRARRDRSVTDEEGRGAAARRAIDSEARMAKATATYVDNRSNAGGAGGI
ncbi:MULTISPECIES: hypothetical protein [Microbacterium]|uniref:Uncharacterized protein n=1 Tax=Microbacterium oleivorans TaxID=273677 RepID=A0A031FXX0_9MICO|nr:hypothetical protein [Microbacterium oleivorans]AZS45111.1 hypothetical protein BWL13_02709 [Microbacterium oleivorans]EZP29112.1 hypothetical protein BW34_00629 [Microbacterium oleivorans]THE06588.1 hypothetical protein E1I21_11170 [Microbacterium oleivorans]